MTPPSLPRPGSARLAQRAVLLIFVLLLGSRLAAESLEEFLQPHVAARIRAATARFANRPPLDLDAVKAGMSEYADQPFDAIDRIAASEPLVQAGQADDAIWLGRASAWQGLSQPLRALADLDRLSPDAAASEEACYTRAMALRARGRVGPAIEQFRKITRGGYWWVYTETPLEELVAQAPDAEKFLRPLLLRPSAPIPPEALAVVRAASAADTAFSLVRLQLAANPADPEALKTIAWICASGIYPPDHSALVEQEFAPQLAAHARLEPKEVAAWNLALRAGAGRMEPGDATAARNQSALIAEARAAGYPYPLALAELHVALFATTDLATLLALEPKVADIDPNGQYLRIPWNRMRLHHSPAGAPFAAALKNRADAGAWAKALAATRAEVVAGRMSPEIYGAMLEIATNEGHSLPAEQRHAAFIAKTDPLELIAAIRDSLPTADPALRETTEGLIAHRLTFPAGNAGVRRHLPVDAPPRYSEDLDVTPDEAAAIAALPTSLERAQAWARRHAPSAALAALGAESAAEDYPTARLRVILLQQLGRLNEALLTLDRSAWRLREDAEAAKFPWAGLRQEFETMHRQVAAAEPDSAASTNAAAWGKLATAWTRPPCPSYSMALLAAAQARALNPRQSEAMVAELESQLDRVQGLPAQRASAATATDAGPPWERLLALYADLPGDPPESLHLRVIRAQPPARRLTAAQEWIGHHYVADTNSPTAEDAMVHRVLKFYVATTRREMEETEHALASLPANSPYAPDVEIARRAVDAAWAKDGLYRPEITLVAASEIARRNQVAADVAGELHEGVLECAAITDPADAEAAWIDLAVDAWSAYEEFRLFSLHDFEAQLQKLPDATERDQLRRLLQEQRPFGPPQATPEVRGSHRLAGSMLTTGERAAAAECIRVLCETYRHLNHARLAVTSLQLLRRQHLRLAEIDEVQATLASIDGTGDYADFKAEFDEINASLGAGSYDQAQAALDRIAPRAKGNPFFTLLAASIATHTDRSDAFHLLVQLDDDFLKIPFFRERYFQLDRTITSRSDRRLMQRGTRAQEIRNRLAEIRSQLQDYNARVGANAGRLQDLTHRVSGSSASQLDSLQSEADRLAANTDLWQRSARDLAAEAESLQAELAALGR